jgi:hypothetical protein
MSSHSLPATPILVATTPEKALKPGKAAAIEEWKRESVMYAYPHLNSQGSVTPDLTDESDRDRMILKEENNSSELECESSSEIESKLASKSASLALSSKRSPARVQKNSKLTPRRGKPLHSPKSRGRDDVAFKRRSEEADDSDTDSDVHLSLCPCGEIAVCPWCWVILMLKRKRTGKIPRVSLSFSQLLILLFVGFLLGYLVHFL